MTMGSEGFGGLVDPCRPDRPAADHGIVAITLGGAGDSFRAAMLSWCATYDCPAATDLDATELRDLAMYASSA